MATTRDDAGREKDSFPSPFSRNLAETGETDMIYIPERPPSVELLRDAVAEAFPKVRARVMTQGLCDADAPVIVIKQERHTGDPVSTTDLIAHQIIKESLRPVFPRAHFLGEEQHPTGLVIIKGFEQVISIDPVDGSSQGLSQAGGWTITVLEHMIDPRNGNWKLGAFTTFNAEGPGLSGHATENYVEYLLPGSEDWTAYSDAGLPPEYPPTVTFGGYKLSTWKKFVPAASRVYERFPDAHVYNTGGAPVALKTLLNWHNVAVTTSPGTAWDYILPLAIIKGGGHVIPLGEDEPVPEKRVLSWYNQPLFAPDNSYSPPALMPATIVPAYVAGMDVNYVTAIARALKKGEHHE